MQRLLVKNFTLSDRLGRQKSASRVDRWLSFALESNVEELNLDFERFALVYVSACLRVFCFLNH